MNTLYRVGRVICNGLCSILFRVKVEGIEHIPTDRGFVLVSNHVSMWDPVMIGIRTKRQIFFMAKDELFRNRFLGAIFRNLGAFPVQRGSGDRSAILRAEEIVRDGQILGLFPEGTRSKGGLLRFKSGAVVVASQTGADVVPVGLYYSRKGLRKRVYVRYGEVVQNHELSLDIKQPRTIKQATNLLKERVDGLIQLSVQEDEGK